MPCGPGSASISSRARGARRVGVSWSARGPAKARGSTPSNRNGAMGSGPCRKRTGCGAQTHSKRGSRPTMTVNVKRICSCPKRSPDSALGGPHAPLTMLALAQCPTLGAGHPDRGLAFVRAPGASTSRPPSGAPISSWPKPWEVSSRAAASPSTALPSRGSARPLPLSTGRALGALEWRARGLHCHPIGDKLVPWFLAGPTLPQGCMAPSEDL